MYSTLYICHCVVLFIAMQGCNNSCLVSLFSADQCHDIPGASSACLIAEHLIKQRKCLNKVIMIGITYTLYNRTLPDTLTHASKQ